MSSSQPTDFECTPNMIKRVTEVAIGGRTNDKRVDEKTVRKESLTYLSALIFGGDRH